MLGEYSNPPRAIVRKKSTEDTPFNAVPFDRSMNRPFLLVLDPVASFRGRGRRRARGRIGSRSHARQKWRDGLLNLARVGSPKYLGDPTRASTPLCRRKAALKAHALLLLCERRALRKPREAFGVRSIHRRFPSGPREEIVRGPNYPRPGTGTASIYHAAPA